MLNCTVCASNHFGNYSHANNGIFVLYVNVVFFSDQILFMFRYIINQFAFEEGLDVSFVLVAVVAIFSHFDKISLATTKIIKK